MKTHVERMTDEINALNTKTAALNTFIYADDRYTGLPVMEQVRMIKQLGFMESYVQVLRERITAATKVG